MRRAAEPAAEPATQLAAQPDATSSDAEAYLYVCGQQTSALNLELTKFLGWRKLEQPVKAAMPPFNRRPDMKTFETTVEYNAPVFGPQIANATMALFGSPEMEALATELGVRIPRYQLSAFVQKKAPKVKALVAVARAPRLRDGRQRRCGRAPRSLPRRVRGSDGGGGAQPGGVARLLRQALP